MNTGYKKIKNLFLRQSYLDAWEDYERSIRKENFIKWDYVILTASNEEQAKIYREQIRQRCENGLLPTTTHYAVLPDPDGKRVGSGGATFNVMRYIAEREEGRENPFADRRILVIHSGGDSKRVPQYSAVGKLFSPVPRELPDGRGSTLFDEFIIGMSGVPSRIREGMLVLSGDVLLLFNPLQIDMQFHGAAAISMKEHVSTGKDHGVFLNNGNNVVKKFLHKQSEENLRKMGAVNEQGNVDLDTGAVAFDSQLLKALYSLISTEGKIDLEKFQRFVSEESRISFYGDFLYPLAEDSTLEDYYKEAAEGVINESLLACRKEIWEVLKPFKMSLLCLAPAEFIHFGTTRELLKLVTQDVDDYEFLEWKKQVVTTASQNAVFSAHNSYVGRKAKVSSGVYLEDSYILQETEIGEEAILSNVKLTGEKIPARTVLHGLKEQDGRYVVRIYGTADNPKGTLKGNAGFLCTTLSEFLEKNQLKAEEVWPDEENYLWFARLYPTADTMQEAVKWALLVYKMAEGTASGEEIQAWKKSKRSSLYESFNQADVLAVGKWQRELENRILSRKFIWALEENTYYQEALNIFGRKGITEEIYDTLMQDAEDVEISLQIRIYYALSRFMKKNKCRFRGNGYDVLEAKCFQTIQNMIFENAITKLPDSQDYRIARDMVHVELPVRVNWGGGWTDTPPHCNELGGVVLNAAVKLNGICPVQISIKKLPEYHIEFESQDVGAQGTVYTTEEIQDCHNPYDAFALHKAALIACGIIPLKGGENLQEILKRLGGGIYLSTQVIGVPKGSGLGTSSILSGACVKGIFEFLGKELSDNEIYDVVMNMEQIMSTGGGWQDQIGGLTPGIKFITTKPGIDQEFAVESVQLSEQVQKELQERFVLIYTGQRRLARNLLREVVGNYIGGRPESIKALKEMKSVAALMKFYLEQGDIDEFARLLTRHWELSMMLDGGSTNTCIDQMFLACEDLLEGKFIAGAGGGGFLQGVLKKGVSKEMLQERMHGVFQDSGVGVWDCEILL